MQDSKIRSRLKAQLSKFVRELTEGLSKPSSAFVGEMLFGIQASQDVKLSEIARSLQEEIPLIKTKIVCRAIWVRRRWKFIWRNGWRNWGADGWAAGRCCVWT